MVFPFSMLRRVIVGYDFIFHQFKKVLDTANSLPCIDLDSLEDARKIYEKVDVSSESIYASSIFFL